MPVRRILTDQIHGPITENLWGVSAVRFNFPSDQETIENVWNNIVEHRMQLDAVMLGLPSTIFIISTITGTLIRNHNARKICPCVNYWVVTEESDYNIMSKIKGVNYLGATPKLLKSRSIPDDDISVLFTILKDNNGGCVPKLLQYSLEHSKIDLPEKAQNLKIYACKPFILPVLEVAVSDLRETGFPAWLQSVP